MVEGKGINDMQKGWRTENNWNKKVYQTWHNMIVRCYSEKYHKTRPTYIGCKVCDDWLILSNFVKDFKLIDGYDREKFLNGELVLDKDIKSNGQNKVYSIENCIFISNEENVRQSNKTMDYGFLQERTGENHPRSIKIAQYDKQTHELIKTWNCSMDIERELGIPNTHINTCCKFWKINCNKEEWFKTYKSYPYKSAGGFVWQYAREEEEN